MKSSFNEVKLLVKIEANMIALILTLITIQSNNEITKIETEETTT